MHALSDTVSRPLYIEPFRELDPARLPKPAGTRYVPRDTPLIGMFDTSRPEATKTQSKARPGTSHAYATSHQLNQAANSRRAAAARPTQPHSIASRCIAALRDVRGQWVSIRALVELSNQHRPDWCSVATVENIYEALKRPRRAGLVESRKSTTIANGVELRIAP